MKKVKVKVRIYTFRWWIKHLIQFNKTALSYKSWKIKYLFHDIEKPFMNLFRPSYSVDKYHNVNSKHHIEYPDIYKQDYEAIAINWECTYNEPPYQVYGRYKEIMGANQRVMFIKALNKLNKQKYKL